MTVKHVPVEISCSVITYNLPNVITEMASNRLWTCCKTLRHEWILICLADIPVYSEEQGHLVLFRNSCSLVESWLSVMTDDKLYLIAVSAARRKINVSNKIDIKIEGISDKLEEQ